MRRRPAGSAAALASRCPARYAARFTTTAPRPLRVFSDMTPGSPAGMTGWDRGLVRSAERRLECRGRPCAGPRRRNTLARASPARGRLSSEAPRPEGSASFSATGRTRRDSTTCPRSATPAASVAEAGPSRLCVRGLTVSRSSSANGGLRAGRGLIDCRHEAARHRRRTRPRTLRVVRRRADVVSRSDRRFGPGPRVVAPGPSRHWRTALHRPRPRWRGARRGRGCRIWWLVHWPSTLNTAGGGSASSSPADEPTACRPGRLAIRCSRSSVVSPSRRLRGSPSPSLPASA